MCIYFIFVAIVTTGVYSTCYYIDLVFIAALIDGGIYTIGLSFVLYTYWKCRGFKQLGDNLLFYYEIYATAVIWLIGTCTYGVVQLLFFFGLDSFASILYMIVCVTAMTAPSLLSIGWIPHKVLSHGVWKKEIQNIESNNENRGDAEDVSGHLFKEALKSEQQFELLIQWMCREFSSENALCLIELIQFKQALIDYLKKKDKGSRFDTDLVDLLNDGVPKLSIVFVDEYGVDGIAKFKSIAHRLFEKYISTRC